MYSKLRLSATLVVCHRSILAYIHNLFQRYALGEHSQFNTAVTAATWDDEDGLWHVEYEGKQENGPRAKSSSVDCLWLVVATGQLSRPQFPRLAGSGSNNSAAGSDTGRGSWDRFQGDCFHSAEWRHDVDLLGKTVVCVGAGASAIQLVPQIAKKCHKLYVIQRTPSYVALKGEFPFPSWLRWLFRHVAPVRLMYRFAIYMRLETLWTAFLRGSWLNKKITHELSEQIRAQIPHEQQAELLPRVR
jgi:cation diffusion facilitator CzcD-associated flavoprotein CzcO